MRNDEKLSLQNYDQLANNSKNLHEKFVQLGRQRFKLTNELLAMLPEIVESKIYKKYASSIEEYCWKFAGLSTAVVQKRLQIEKHIQDKLLLKEAINKHGMNKVGLVATLATAETEKFWVDKIENMSKAALFELTKEIRNKPENFIPGNEIEPENNFCQAAEETMTIKISGETLFMFRRLKERLAENASNEEFLKKIFERYLEELEAKKKRINELKKAQSGSKIEQNQKKLRSRYIKAATKKHILARSNNKCEYPNCNKLATQFHHAEPFAQSRNHQSLKHLCKVHHEFMHNGIVKHQQEETQKWQLRLTAPQLTTIDQLYRKHRELALL